MQVVGDQSDCSDKGAQTHNGFSFASQEVNADFLLRYWRSFGIDGLGSFGGMPTVSIRVGADKIVFIIHKGLLCEASPFFKAAFTLKFEEYRTGTMSLPEDDVDTFNPFVRWLYSGNLAYDDGDCCFQLAKLYILADKLRVKELKNCVIDKIIYIFLKWRPTLKTVVFGHVCANCPEGSGLRRLLATWCVWHVKMEWFGDPLNRETLDIPGFGGDLAIAFASKSSSGSKTSPLEARPSSFHDVIL